MPTVIDTLVLELGLDPRRFSEGQRQALSDLRRFQQDAEAGGKNVESATKRVGNVLENFRREVVNTFGVALGGVGIAAFINRLTNMDAATGRLAHTMQMSTQETSAWQGAIKQVGGSVESANSALAGLSGEMSRFMLTGQSQMLPVLSRLGISLFDQNKQLKTAGQLWLEIADSVKGMTPREATAFLSMIPGINQDMINLLLKGRDAIEAYLAAASKAGTATPQSSRQAQEFQREISLLGDAATNAGRALLDVLYPALTKIATALRELIQLSPSAAGVIGALGGVVGLSAIRRGAQRLAPGIFGQAAGTSIAGRVAGIVASAPVAVAGAYFGSTTEASAATLNPKWYEPFMGPVPGAAPGASPPPLPVKPGAGVASPAVQRVTEAIRSVPGLNRVTAMNDPYHAFLGGAHPAGRAVDVTIQNPAKSAEVAEQVRASLAAQGIKATVIDEYANPSKNATAGHLHISVDEETAGRLGGAAAGFRPGAPAAAAGAVPPVGAGPPAKGGDTTTVSVSIGEVNVNAPQAKDAQGVAGEIAPALERAVRAGAANFGAN